MWETSGMKLVASRGFAPRLPVSETGALLIMQRGSLKMVAREGVAPPTSLCKRDMILFHHRAKELATAAGLAPTHAPSKGAVLLLNDAAKMVTRQGNAPCSAD